MLLKVWFSTSSNSIPQRWLRNAGSQATSQTCSTNGGWRPAACALTRPLGPSRTLQGTASRIWLPVGIIGVRFSKQSLKSQTTVLTASPPNAHLRVVGKEGWGWQEGRVTPPRWTPHRCVRLWKSMKALTGGRGQLCPAKLCEPMRGRAGVTPRKSGPQWKPDQRKNSSLLQCSGHIHGPIQPANMLPSS